MRCFRRSVKQVHTSDSHAIRHSPDNMKKNVVATTAVAWLCYVAEAKWINKNIHKIAVKAAKSKHILNNRTL